MAINAAIQKLVEIPLYENLPLDAPLQSAITNYLDWENVHLLSIDLYCPFCKANSTFNPSNEKQIDHETSFKPSIVFLRDMNPLTILHYRCARDVLHYLSVQILMKEKQIQKIGQYPSRASIEQHNFDRFSKIIPEEKLDDIKRASGLASHGIGAGSFVYLRRVFEYLLESAHQNAKIAHGFDEDLFQRSRVLEKIEMLSAYLPSILVENKIMYSILSKGVHELSEDECRESFGLMLDTIELVLEELLSQNERKKREEKIKKDLGKLHSKLSEA